LVEMTKTCAVFPPGVVLLGFLEFPFLSLLVSSNTLTSLWKIGGWFASLTSFSSPCPSGHLSGLIAHDSWKFFGSRKSTHEPVLTALRSSLKYPSTVCPGEVLGKPTRMVWWTLTISVITAPRYSSFPVAVKVIRK